MKRIFAGLLSMSLAFSLGTSAFAANREEPELFRILEELYIQEAQEQNGGNVALAAVAADDSGEAASDEGADSESEDSETVTVDYKTDSEHTAQITLGPAETDEDQETVSLPVYVTAEAGLNGVQMSVTYDDGLTYADQSGNGSFNTEAVSIASAENTLSLIFANAQNVAQDEGSGILLTTLYFNVDDGVSGELSFDGTVDYITYREDDAESNIAWICTYANSVNAAATGCTVEIAAPYVLGDVNGDGEITPADATLVLKRYVDSITDSTDGFTKEAADVDGDGEITPADATLILKYYVGSITEFPIS
ncbi:MAG: dockerin type I repeat-containing protein [Lachnospiraceae bacterium]|nr:dockerin type I repeat-containing protein [Lachnospiraceae bacterium]